MAESISIASVLIDETLYPRHKVSSANVSSLKEAINAGSKDVPPILVNAKTKVLVDGMHRLLAYKSIYGEDGSIPANLKEYKSRREMLDDSIRINVRQGMRLTAWDMARAINLLLEAHAAVERICDNLAITEKRYNELAARLKRVNGSTETVVLKHGTPKLEGQESVTHEQAEFVKGPASGMPVAFHLHQIVAAFSSNSVLIDESLEVLMKEVIEVLEGALNE